MPLELHPLEIEDLESYARLFYKTFRDEPLGIFWTREPTAPSYTTWAQYRGKSLLAQDPHSYMWKVIDPSLPTDDEACAKVNDGVGRQLVAVGYWQAHPSARSEEEMAKSFVGPPPLPESNIPVRDEFMKNIFYARGKYTAEPCMVLYSLVTLQRHQRRGAGKMLVRAGQAKARELGLDCYLESSAAGRRLYESCGFETQEVLKSDLRKWGGGEDSHYVMWNKTGAEA